MGRIKSVRRQYEKSKKLFENRFLDILSKGTIKTTKLQTIEQQKKLAIEKLVRYHDGEAIAELLSYNSQICRVIENLKRSIKDRKEIEYRVKKLIKKDEKNTKISEKLFSEILESLPKTSKFDSLRREYLDKGINNLAVLEKKLSELEDIDADEIKIRALISILLKKLEMLIIKQDRISKKIIRINKKTYLKELMKKLLRIKTPIQPLIDDLIYLLKDEIIEVNNILRNYIQNAKIENQEGKITEIYWLEDKEQKLSEDIEILLKKYKIPKIDFLSGLYVTVPLTQHDALVALESGVLNSGNFPTDYKKLKWGIETLSVKYIPYEISKLPKKVTSVGFVFPLEQFMFNHFFISDLRSYIELLDSPEDREKLYYEFYKKIEHFDVLINDLKEKYNKWMREAEEVDKEFRFTWFKKAIKVINEGFSKKWIREEYIKLKVYGNIAFDLVLTHYKKDDLYFMDFKEFKKAIMEVKDYYKNTLCDCHRFFFNASLNIPIDYGIFVVPKINLLFWEKYFKNRPKYVFYHDGDNFTDGVSMCLENCRKNKVYHPAPICENLLIFDAKTGKQVKTY